jgi:anti-sigma factor RsiW
MAQDRDHVGDALQELLDGRVPSRTRWEVDAHLEECERCRAEWHGVPFTTRVFDLGMMGYRLEGGRVHRLAGRLSALFVYRGEGGKILVCEMYSGHARELPGGAVLRENKGIRFYVYRTGRTTTVFWQERDVVCALSSDARHGGGDRPRLREGDGRLTW